MNSYAVQRGAAKCTPCASPASTQTFTDDAGNKCWKPLSNALRTGCGAPPSDLEQHHGTGCCLRTGAEAAGVWCSRQMSHFVGCLVCTMPGL